ncbi:hypothetical protein [Galbibacter sp.]|uniref:hypothetical protein n=1 Tax=Galbibacter sp. TaxID=2918471 RepID=UPI002C5A3DD2|nr:hypothetical protein [Galbibacter sp.]HLV63447.1 hypothetical protein [Galbibacter sp.]
MMKDPLKLLKTIFIILSVIIFIPIAAFILNFGNTFISKDINHWGEFGADVGGVVNTIISLASLIVLSFLTYYVAENSNKHTQELHLKNKRLDIYQKVCGQISSVESNINRLAGLIDLNNYSIKIKQENIDLVIFAEVINQVEQNYIYIDHMHISYEYYFPCSLNSDEYHELDKKNKELRDIITTIKNTYLNNQPYPKDLYFDIKYMDAFYSFTEQLEKEIKSS